MGTGVAVFMHVHSVTCISFYCIDITISSMSLGGSFSTALNDAVNALC